MRTLEVKKILAVLLAVVFGGQCISLSVFSNDTIDLSESIGFSASMDELTQMQQIETMPLDEEFATGYLPESIEPTYVAPPEISAFAALPSSVDLSADDYFPPIGNQGKYNSCTAFATTYYQFTYAAAKLNNWNIKGVDSDKVYSPKWTYNFVSFGDDGGSNFLDNLTILQQAGAVKWDEFYFSDSPTKDPIQYREWCTDADAMKNALNTRVSEIHYDSFSPFNVETPIKSPNSAALTNMKTLLNSGHVLSFSTESSTFKLDSLNITPYGKVVTDVRKLFSGGAHAMCIVGYDDNLSYDLNGNGSIENYEKGAFKIANSWGDAWGNNGYIWLMYDALNKTSNISNFNSVTRQPALDLYGYFWFDVANYTPKLTAEVSLRSAKLDDISCKITYKNQDIITAFGTHIRDYWPNNDMAHGFAGTTGYSDGIIIVDFDQILTNLDDNWRTENIILEISDTKNNNYTTTVKNVKFIEDEAVVQNYTPNRELNDNSNYFSYQTIPAPTDSLAIIPSILSFSNAGSRALTLAPTTDNNAVLWTSSDLNIATVDASGVVTAIGIGNATITAETLNTGLTATCQIKNTGTYPTSFQASPLILGMAPGETYQYPITVQPVGAWKGATWTSSPSRVAKVSNTGLVTAVSDGSATITATTPNGLVFWGRVNVTSVQPTNVALDKSNATFFAGETVALQATVSPTTATNKTVAWSSSDAAIATVDTSGVVTGVSAGTATITAMTVNGLTATCEVTIAEEKPILPTSVVIEIGDGYDTSREDCDIWLYGGPGERGRLTATVFPADADQTVTWNSDNLGCIAIIDEDGLFEVQGEFGYATITATTVNGITDNITIYSESPQR